MLPAHHVIIVVTAVICCCLIFFLLYIERPQRQYCTLYWIFCCLNPCHHVYLIQGSHFNKGNKTNSKVCISNIYMTIKQYYLDVFLQCFCCHFKLNQQSIVVFSIAALSRSTKTKSESEAILHCFAKHMATVLVSTWQYWCIGIQKKCSCGAICLASGMHKVYALPNG